MITIKPHAFKATEWSQNVTKQMLVDRLREFQTVQKGLGISVLCTYYPSGWSDEAVRFFLELYHWLYRESLPQEHHVRCIHTIIQRGELR